MKRNLLIFLLMSAVLCGAFAQKLPVVGIMEVQVSNSGVTASDAANMTRQITNELSSWGTISVVQGSTGAEYVIRGSLSRQGSSFVLAASTLEASTGRVLNEYKEQASAVNNISIISFCAQAVDKVPLPNYLLGKWRSEIVMPDGPVICIIEFRADRTVAIERYDTWESKKNNALRYEGFGAGTYSYAGYANRTININSQQVRIDATVNVNLKLEDTLPEQTSINQNGMSLVFNGDKSSFDFIVGSFLCGKNYDGPSVYSSDTIAFRSFVKVR